MLAEGSAQILPGILQPYVLNALAEEAAGKHCHHADVDKQADDQGNGRLNAEVGNGLLLAGWLGCVDLPTANMGRGFGGMLQAVQTSSVAANSLLLAPVKVHRRQGVCHGMEGETKFR